LIFWFFFIKEKEQIKTTRKKNRIGTPSFFQDSEFRNKLTQNTKQKTKTPEPPAPH
jgi:hypothetical protein